MIRALLATVALIVSVPAHADAFRDREIAYQALNAIVIQGSVVGLNMRLVF